jgi:hypothetical protein
MRGQSQEASLSACLEQKPYTGFEDAHRAGWKKKALQSNAKTRKSRTGNWLARIRHWCGKTRAGLKWMAGMMSADDASMVCLAASPDVSHYDVIWKSLLSSSACACPTSDEMSWW